MAQATQIVKSSFGTLFVLTVMATLPTLAMAADSADRHLNRGVQLLSRDKNKEALEEFRTANALSPSPEAIVQIGLAESALKLWMDAEKHIVEGLSADTDNWVKHNRQPIEEQLAEVRSHLGWLIVTGTPGTEVFIEGIAVGRLPLPARIRRVEGPVAVQGRLPGHQAIVKNVEVLGKGNQAVRLEFAIAAPIPPAPTVTTPPPAPQTAAASSPARVSSNIFFYQSLPWLSTVAGALALGDLALILQTNHSCTGTSSCGPSKALEASVGIAGITGLTMGGVALLMGVTHRSDPQLVKPVLLVSSALAAAGAIAGGVTLVRDNQHSGSDLKWGYGAATIGAGSIVLILDTFAIFERTPERVRPVRVALVPTPGGFNLLGTF